MRMEEREWKLEMLKGFKPSSPEGGARTPSAKPTRSDCSAVGFPLTPALSLGERELRGLPSRLPMAPQRVARRNRIPPLPEGEGRGEGELNPPRRGPLAARGTVELGWFSGRAGDFPR